MILTPAIKIAYASRIAAKSAVGFRSLKRFRGAQAPITSVLFLFVAPEDFPFGSVHGETFGSAGLASCRRSANPVHAATSLFRSGLWQWWFNRHEFTIMSTLFVLRDGISPRECREQIHVLNEQMLVLIETLTSYTETRESISLPENFNKFGWTLWLLGTLLEQQNALLTRRVD